MISGSLWGLMAALHLLRLFLRFPAVIADWAIPLWISGVAILMTATLGLWAFPLAARSSR